MSIHLKAIEASEAHLHLLELRVGMPLTHPLVRHEAGTAQIFLEDRQRALAEQLLMRLQLRHAEEPLLRHAYEP